MSKRRVRRANDRSSTTTPATQRGDKPGALLRPLQGAATVARAMIAATRRHDPTQSVFRRATINGVPGVVRFEGGRAQAVLAFELGGVRIQSVWVISNPQKLRHVQPRD